ncbi:MAG: sirohydrochlorin chelatase [Terriglobia bacterium]
MNLGTIQAMKDGSPKTGILLFAHGSRVEEANEGVRSLAQQVQQPGGFSYVRAAFLEMAEPDLRRAIAEAVAAGLDRIIVVPYFLTMGIHLRRDLPGLLARERASHPGVEFRVTEPLQGHPLLPTLLLDRIRAAAEKGGANK